MLKVHQDLGKVITVNKRLKADQVKMTQEIA